MKQRIEMTQDGIRTAFNELGWSLRDGGVGFYYFVTPDGKNTGLRIWFPQDDQRAYEVKLEFDDYNGGVCFILDHCKFLWGEDRRSIDLMANRNKHVFIGFYNFNKEKSQ